MRKKHIAAAAATAAHGNPVQVATRRGPWEGVASCRESESPCLWIRGHCATNWAQKIRAWTADTKHRYTHAQTHTHTCTATHSVWELNKEILTNRLKLIKAAATAAAAAVAGSAVAAKMSHVAWGLPQSVAVWHVAPVCGKRGRCRATHTCNTEPATDTDTARDTDTAARTDNDDHGQVEVGPVANIYHQIWSKSIFRRWRSIDRSFERSGAERSASHRIALRFGTIALRIWPRDWLELRLSIETVGHQQA